MRSTKMSRLAALAAAVLVVGVGVAAAEGGLDTDPTDETTTTTVEDTTTTTVEDTTTTTVEDTTTTTLEDIAETSLDEGDDAGDGVHPDNHGAIVSQAAQDHSQDERCGTHGQYVRSVAQGLEDCTVPPGHGNGDDVDGEDDAATTQSGRSSTAPNVPDHANGKSSAAANAGGRNR